MDERQTDSPSGAGGIPTDLETLQEIAMRQLDWALTFPGDQVVVTAARCSLAASAIVTNLLLREIVEQLNSGLELITDLETLR